MTYIKQLANRIRGWLPKEHISYSIKRTTTASKLLAVYFILIFAIGILLRLFVTPLFLPGAAEITDRSIVMFILVGVMLVAMYYLKTQGSPKQIRTIYTLGIAFPIGFTIFIVTAIVARAITGNPVQGFDTLLIIAFGYTIGFIIGIPASKKMQERFPGRF